MRVDDGTTYCLPALTCDCCSANTTLKPTNNGKATNAITLDLQGLPMIHDNGIHTGVGARGWYNSAVLSAMLLLGHEEGLHQHLNKSTTILELGAGAIGLVGMTMAWILSQQEHSYTNSKILLTDNDPECLDQLEVNIQSVFKSLQEYHHHPEDQEEEESKTSSTTFSSLPEIKSKFLDWDDHGVDQAVLMDDKIDLVVGAELAYTTNNALALQVAKILEVNPKAVVWIVQFPRNGWFQVFQMQLKQANSNICIQKLQPETIHENVHKLAQRIMPTPIMCGTLNDIKALRITLGESSFGPGKVAASATFDLTEQIRQGERLSQQLNQAQLDALNSHWDAD